MYESEYPMGAGGGMIEALGIFFWVFTVVAYVYFAYT